MARRLKFDDKDVDIMARTLFGEAASGNVEDAEVIASTIYNRIVFNNWPDTATAVCLQPWQYSCWNSNDPGRARIQNASGRWFELCRDIAFSTLKGVNSYIDLGLTHYYATYVARPKWAKGKKHVHAVPNAHGEHRFFNNIDTVPPKTAAQALDQIKPMTSSRSVQGSAVVAGSGALAVSAGTVATLAPVVPVVQGVAKDLESNAPALLIALGIVVVLAALYVIRGRLDDRKKGLR